MNYMIYCKLPNDKRFGAMDVSNGRVGVGQVFATLFPEKQKAADIADRLAGLYPGSAFQVRTAVKGTIVYKAKVHPRQEQSDLVEGCA